MVGLGLAVSGDATIPNRRRTGNKGQSQEAKKLTATCLGLPDYLEELLEKLPFPLSGHSLRKTSLDYYCDYSKPCAGEARGLAF